MQKWWKDNSTLVIALLVMVLAIIELRSAFWAMVSGILYIALCEYIAYIRTAHKIAKWNQGYTEAVTAAAVEAQRKEETTVRNQHPFGFH